LCWFSRKKTDAAAVAGAARAPELLELAQGELQSRALIAALNATLVASIGPVHGHALRDAGVSPRLGASPPKLRPFVAMLDAALDRAGLDPVF